MRERELFEGSADRKLHRLLHQAEFDWAWSGKHMTHDSRRTRFPLLARPVSDASVRAVIPLARNISAIDNKVNLFLLGAPTARERLGTPSRETEGDGKRSPGCFRDRKRTRLKYSHE